MSDKVFTKFAAHVHFEGAYASDADVFQPMALLEYALQLALFSQAADEVAQLIAKTTEQMLQSLSCRRRKMGDVVCVADDGETGVYQIVGRDEPDSCTRCGNPACREWPTLVELAPDGLPNNTYEYHVSECRMRDR